MKTQNQDFIQDSSYAAHFGSYKGILSKILNHDPSMFNLSKNLKIVDVGCGFGDYIKILKKRGYKNLIGIEPDTLCRISCIKDGLDVRSGTISKTGLVDNFADVVIVNQVFHHTKDFNNAVLELSRIIKPGGILCFLEPSPTTLRRIMDVLTFKTSLPQYIGFVKIRYEVMKLEMATGAYTNFLNNQNKFHKAINRYFTLIWLRQGWFFQFGKYKKR